MSSTTIRPRATSYGPTFCFKGLENRGLLHPAKRRQTHMPTTAVREHAQREPFGRATLDLGQPAILGPGDACRWLSLRSGVGPVARLGRAIRWPIRRSCGTSKPIRSWRDEIDRRGLGRRGAVSGRQLLWRPLEGMERTVSRRCARLRQGRSGPSGQAGLAFPGQPRYLRSPGKREPEQSINFVTCHDGFTLNDLVSYNEKHNLAKQRRKPRRAQPQPQLELRRRGPDR